MIEAHCAVRLILSKATYRVVLLRVVASARHRRQMSITDAREAVSRGH